MLWPMVLPPYHSLCRKNQGLLFRDKELSWTFPGRDSDEARPSWRIIPWHLTVGGPLPDLSPSSGRPHCHWGGKDFTCMPRHLCTTVVLRHFHSTLGKKSGYLNTACGLCGPWRGGLGKSLAFWISDLACVRGSRYCVSKNNSPGRMQWDSMKRCAWKKKEKKRKDMHGSALKTLEAVGMFQIPWLLSK